MNRFPDHIIPEKHAFLLWFGKSILRCSRIILTSAALSFSSALLTAQTIDYVYPVAQGKFSVVVDEEQCHACEIHTPGDLACSIWGGTSYTPEGLLYGIGTDATGDINVLFEIDYPTGACTAVLTSPIDIPETTHGLVGVGNGIFYSMAWQSDLLYRWDINANTVTLAGTTGYPNWGELCMSNGSIYYITRTFGPNTASIIRLDPNDPTISTQMGFFDSPYGFFGISATTDPNVLVAQEVWLTGGVDLYRLNIIDGSVNFVCDITPPGWGGYFSHITTLLEYDLFPYLPPYIDLDCDDSSGAIDADFNALPFSCLTDGVHIIDIDPRIRSDASISQMTVRIANPIPDAPDEVLDITGNINGITVSGLNTPTLTLTNTGGASLNDFLDQLDNVVYINVSYDITEGLRTVEVQFTSTTSAQSNIASAYIQVDDLPDLDIDIGPDIMACDGESVILSANISGQEYLWSTGEDSEEITVNAPGNYSVTVTSSLACPDRDSVTVTYIPIVQVWLTGDTITCVDEDVQLVITTDAAFPIDVTITPDPGDPFTIEDISASGTYNDFPFDNTEYFITGVETSQPACVILADPEQTIEIHPEYWDDITTAWLCPGDSILLGNTYYSDAGFYDVYLQSIYGCDSLVELQIFHLPAEYLFYSFTTCDPTQAGIYFTYLPNSNGCDTVVQTTYTLLPIDTNEQIVLTCRLAETGISIDTLVNQFGCDSFLVTTTLYDPPADTTFLIQPTCDSAALGVFTQLLESSSGCDSLVVTNVIIPPPDTTTLLIHSCDTADVGVTELLLNGTDGCDSLVITHTQLITNDTTYVYNSSCDSSSLGIFITAFPVSGNCDSVIITQVDYMLADSTFLSDGSCFESDTGYFVTTLINQNGCDSFVFRTVFLYPSHTTMLTLSSCSPQDTGLFIQNLSNQWGCDSVITTRITLLPSHTTTLASSTCDISQSGLFLTELQNQFGCDSTILHTVTYLPPDTTHLTAHSCDSNETGIVETVFQNTYGCDSLVILSTSLFPLPQVTIQSLGDYNGFDISCFGGTDGVLFAEVIGIPAFAYLWSTSMDTETLQNVAAGYYSVTVSDGNGCEGTDDIDLTEPPPLEIELTVSEPECFENELGIIFITAEGGVGPYLYSKDSIAFSDEPVFENLGDGLYKLFVLDQNDCLASAIIGIHIPLDVDVDLGDNQVLGLGDSALINAMVNVPYALLDSIHWTGIEEMNCDTCLQQIVYPIITTVYAIQVVNDDGCRDDDEMTITVVRNDEIYIPNVFSPNGDGINDLLEITTGSYVERIETFEIFDRWGNQVFNRADTDPDDPYLAWDGKFRNEQLNPGVYAYRMLAILKDETSIVRFGDITLIR